MSTEKRISANRRKAKGPTDTTTTRWNAVTGLTKRYDIEDYERILVDLTLRINPVGPVEEFLLRLAALDLARWTHS
jgi:hypothetical protein